MSNFRETEVTTSIDEDGVETTTKKEKYVGIVRNEEPDYIKVYTNMWAEFNGVPSAYRGLFLQLAIRMSYCNSSDLKNAQIVATGGLVRESIQETLGIKERAYKYGLQALTKSGAIKKVKRGWYQINPTYAGKGEWKYNPKLNRGGVEDLVAVFKFKDKTVNTRILWADDGGQTEFTEIYRKGLKDNMSYETVLTRITAIPKPSEKQQDDAFDTAI